MKKILLMIFMVLSFFVLVNEVKAKSTLPSVMTRAINLLPQEDYDFLFSQKSDQIKPIVVISDQQIKDIFGKKMSKTLLTKSMFSLSSGVGQTTLPIYVRSESLFITSVLEHDSGENGSLPVISVAAKISHEIEHFKSEDENVSIEREKSVFLLLAKKFGHQEDVVTRYLEQL
ncbi:MAG: hypothetical protein R3B41_02430 [Candidatus Doudnabacteria bacterium]